MAGRETADIVFCIDASGSMSQCIHAVKEHVVKLLETINKSGLQTSWDVRFDFLAYSNSYGGSMRLETLTSCGSEVIDGLYSTYSDLKQSEDSKQDANNGGFLKKIFNTSKTIIASSQNKDVSSERFFTKDLEVFKNRLRKIRCDCDEATVLALDICADFPFRDAKNCHRVVILLTDEAVKDGQFIFDSQKRLLDVAKKYQDKKIMLFMVTPNCDSFDTLSQIDKCEWTIDESVGLKELDFSKLMQSIGKSVSISQTNGSGKDGPQPIFDENKWTPMTLCEDSSYVKCVGLNPNKGSIDW